MTKQLLSTQLLHAIDRIELKLDADNSVLLLTGIHEELGSLESQHRTAKNKNTKYEDHILKCAHEIGALTSKIEALRSELRLKDEKLSELTHGIPIEKANKNKKYLTFDIYGVPRICSFIDLCWQYDVGDMIVPFDSAHRLYPLPSQNSQTQEGG